MSFSNIKNPDAGQFVSRNPATKQLLKRYPEHSSAAVESAIAELRQHVANNCLSVLPERIHFLQRFGNLLRDNRDTLAELITGEMGKLLTESLAEVDKSISLCEQFSQHGPEWLEDQYQDGARISFQPVGVVLAVMPWNFPLWQVLRCAVPAWLAGNTIALKHATNVSGCALLLEQLAREAANGASYLRTLLIGVDKIALVVADNRIRALHFTGSITVGRKLARLAAAHGKRSVLELGGSDPFVVLPGADIERAAEAAVTARFRNAGQSCTAAKRLIVMAPVYEQFVEAFSRRMLQLEPGDPMLASTTLAPLARQDFLLRIRQQLEQAGEEGAKVLASGKPVTDSGWFIPPMLLEVLPNSVLTTSETFGPVAAIQCAASVDEAIFLANDSRYGLAASLWCGDSDVSVREVNQLADRLQCGLVAINRLTRSSPLHPFAGVKDSGYGYELGRLGLMELVTAKVVLGGAQY